jgi:hypothetical protein
LQKATSLALGDIKGYLNGDWDGNWEGWQATADNLEVALEGVDVFYVLH